ncbi:hypothetical protein BGZ74_011903 [Mortierella antarctica]|nr:hypothetical protein BGZ74_011903 [Mortierella antarctica]
MITPPSTNNHDPHNYAHGSPHSPHTAPDPMVLAQPEYSQQHSIGSPSSAYQNINYPSSTTKSPHTAALQYDSPNPNPQLGHVHLDFIPLPTNRPSAPPQLPTSIPAEARYQTVPLPYVAPPPPPSVPYPVPPSTDTQQPHYENVTFVDATPIDMSKEKYKLSPAAGVSTVLEDLRNPRKKIFWIFNIIVLAIIFGVLGATVWKPDSNGNGEGRSHTPTPKPSVIPRTSPVVATPELLL